MSKKDNGAGVILAYLNEKNRPYSAQDVFSNLQKQHGLGKTAVVKAMELLALEGKIKEKIYGKQKIYFADQAQFKDVNDADLKAMDHQISELSEEVQSLTQSCRQLDAGDIFLFGTLFVLGFRHDKCNPRGLSKEQKGVPGEFKTLKKKKNLFLRIK
uniref:Homologous-pairing protein 2 homolog n=1 Tax=Pundamilia nyererei TaxID=303518 RepID=A0A3B4FU76_9CICH